MMLGTHTGRGAGRMRTPAPALRDLLLTCHGLNFSGALGNLEWFLGLQGHQEDAVGTLWGHTSHAATAEAAARHAAPRSK